ncbi:MAG: BTAD domain-containing putative transcriptional regulator [Dermatophilaceae bacterium]|nr:hypothetical protein [Intrasporangiaceae bacterium]
MAPPIHIRLFGPTTVIDRDTPERVTSIRGKQGRILAVLGLQPGHPVHKDRLAEAVWDGRPPPSFRQALDSDVCVLRRRAGLGPGRSSALATTASGYVLDPERVSVDLADARALAERARTQQAALAVASAHAALELASGELLEDEPYAVWADEARSAWRSTEVDLCLLGSRTAIVTGDVSLAIRCGQRALARSPASEQAAVQLMRALWWGDRRTEAIHVFLTLRESMLEEFGEQPGQEAQNLYLTILRDGAMNAGDGVDDSFEHLRLALKLLRGALDVMPGVRAPAHDADLAAAAAAALAQERDRWTAGAAIR